MEFHYDIKAADKVVNWIEKYCTHVNGELGGLPFILAPWQRELIIKPLFGWKREDGSRKYRRVFVFVARKNGKSTMGSALAIYLLSSDGEIGSQVYSAASDRGQAGIIHEDAKTMIKQSPELSTRIQSFRNSIIYEKTASFYKVLSRAADNKHGFNSHGIIFDELHTQPNRELWDVLTTSIGSRLQPLVIVFTTAGYDRNTICYEQYDYAKKVRDGIIKDDEFLPVIYETDPQDDIQDPKAWAKANPNLGIGLKLDYVTKEAARAVNEPSYENTFRRLQLNQWTTQETKWITDELWMRGNKPLDLQALRGRTCIIGLDLSTVRDLSVVLLDFKIEAKHYILPFFFCPALSARERTKKDGVNYDLWIKQGYIIETPGNSIDYEYIEKKLMELKEVYKIKKVEYDPWRAEQIIPKLIDQGFTCEPFGQGFKSMSNPTKEVEALLLNENIVHGGNPVMRWMCSNVMIVADPAGNIKIAKDKSTEKVDGMVALVEAIGGWLGPNTGDSVYNDLTKRPEGVRRL